MKRACFICGTDTDVGKSLITAGLLKNLPQANALKLIQTGELFDQHLYARACPEAEVSTLEHFVFPAAPSLAARLENRCLEIDPLIESIEQRVRTAPLTLIETSGGVCVPINNNQTFLDLMARLSYPVVLVIKNTLGAINHALLSIMALRNRGLEIEGLIFTHTTRSTAATETLLADNIESIQKLSGLPSLAVIPYIPGLQHGQGKISDWNRLAAHLQGAAQRLIDEPPKLNDRKFELRHLWHPYTSAVEPSRVWEVARTAGNHIVLKDGTRLIDGMSSWWCAVHGYGHPALIKALQEQAGEMSHVMFGGLTHRPAIELAKALLPIIPGGLEKAFFADSGSVAIEVALKMAVQYWQGQGQPHKTKFMALLGGYHGDTLGAMSVSDPHNGRHHAIFSTIVPENVFAPRPASPFHHDFLPESVSQLEEVIAKHRHQCAALVVEPIVQGAGGMWMYHPRYLQEAARLCQQYGLLLIVDEIATGFGRTGKLFASQWADINPDIMCLGKALTGGSLSLAATLTSEQIARGIEQRGEILMHGPTFMANPLACRVATASIELLLNSPWQKNVSTIETQMSSDLAGLADHPAVADVRVLGGIGVIEMHEPLNAQRLQHFFVEDCGVWIRPFSRLLYIMPPFTIRPEQLKQLTQAMKQALENNLWE